MEECSLHCDSTTSWDEREVRWITIPRSVFCYPAGTGLAVPTIERLLRLEGFILDWTDSLELADRIYEETTHWQAASQSILFRSLQQCLVNTLLQSRKALRSGTLRAYTSISELCRDIEAAMLSDTIPKIVEEFGICLDMITSDFKSHHESNAITLLLSARHHFDHTCCALSAVGALLECEVHDWRTTGAVSTRKVLQQYVDSIKVEEIIIPGSGIRTRIKAGVPGYGSMGPGEWLNDDCVNLHVEIINSESGVKSENDAIVLSTYFCGKHLLILPGQKERGYLVEPEKAARFGALATAQERLTPWKKVIMPFNVTHNHWLVACVNVEEGAIVVYDSLSGRSDTGTSAHESIIDSLWDFLIRLYASLGWSNIAKEKWCHPAPFEYPRQRNDYDCGVYAILYIIHLSRASKINDPSVPKRYHIPEPAENLNGNRLVLLEEIEWRRLGKLALKIRGEGSIEDD